MDVTEWLFDNLRVWWKGRRVCWLHGHMWSEWWQLPEGKKSSWCRRCSKTRS